MALEPRNAGGTEGKAFLRINFQWHACLVKNVGNEHGAPGILYSVIPCAVFGDIISGSLANPEFPGRDFHDILCSCHGAFSESDFKIKVAALSGP